MPARRLRPLGGLNGTALLAGFLVAALTLGLAACDGSTASPSAAATGPAGSDPAASGRTYPPTPAATEAGPTVTPATQTDTAWGRIWDDLPPSFPRPAGASPTQTGSGPASAELLVPAELEAVVSDLQARFAGTILTVADVTTPVEDGSRTMELAGPGECRARIVLAPVDDATALTIWYGAACPWQ